MYLTPYFTNIILNKYENTKNNVHGYSNEKPSWESQLGIGGLAEYHRQPSMKVAVSCHASMYLTAYFANTI